MELLIIGLDGLSYNMLRKFNVETPFIDSVRSRGISGDLDSVDTPTTLPAWTSFATGMDPGSHGVSTMLSQAPDYSIEPTRCNTSHPALYDVLDDAVFINLPASIDRSPAGKDVHLVSSILASGPEDAVPPALHSLPSFDEYIVHDDGELKSAPESYVEHLRETVRARFAFAMEAFQEYDPRVGFVLFSTPDWVGHFLQFGSKTAIQERWYRSVVELVDERAAALVDQTEAENIVLLSDHGFEHKPQSLHLQEWFLDQGYVVKASDSSPLQRIVTGTAKQIAKRSESLFDILRTVYLRTTSAVDDEHLSRMVDFNPDINFPASTAWHLRYGCIYINNDWFEDPSVHEIHALRRKLQDQLAALTDEDGNPVFSSVQRPAEVYNNPDPERRFPDLIARPATGVLPVRAFSPTGDPVIPTPGHDHYDHRYKGMIAAEGPLFGSGAIDEMSIVDVAPTLLHALGESLIVEFDGEVRTDALAIDSEQTWIPMSDAPSPQIRTDEKSGDREAAVRDQLRQLGYFE